MLIGRCRPTMRESLRRFLCAGCGVGALICSVCDRGQRYCPGACARAAHTRSRREANRRYQRTPRGRLKSAERSRRYRDRRRVTDQGSPPVPDRAVLSASATEAQSETPAQTSAAKSCDLVQETTSRVAASGRSGIDAVRCMFCRRWCKPWIRYGPFRRRSSPRKVGRARYP